MIVVEQSKWIETTVSALQDERNTTLPPLMNPSMLEASDDLTSLSHLSEPAGMSTAAFVVKPSADGSQSCKRSSYVTYRKRSTRTVALC